MSIFESLKAAKDIPSVKFLEFTRIESKKIYDMCVFFEGEDEKYYAARINSNRNDLTWFGITCNGKKNVLEVRSKIRNHPEYKDSFAIFFVDSDFDDNSEIVEFNDIFITPTYSIENNYITDNAFDLIMRAEFNVSPFNEHAECYKKAFSYFSKTKLEYFNHIKNFNKWIYLSRKIKANDSKLNVNNIKFNDLVKVESTVCNRVYDCDNHKLLFPLLELTDEEIGIEFNHDAEKAYRGKQHLEFMREFLLILKSDRCKKNDREIFRERSLVKLNLTPGSCISELSQYAETPDSLYIFLGKLNKPIVS